MTEHREDTVADELRKSLRWLTIATVVLFVLLVGLGLFVWLDGKGTKDALCAYRSDLQTRVIQTEEFLRDHPNGSKGLGISRGQLITNIVNQNRVIKAFSGLNCGPVPEASETTTKERAP